MALNPAITPPNGSIKKGFANVKCFNYFIKKVLYYAWQFFLICYNMQHKLGNQQCLTCLKI